MCHQNTGESEGKRVEFTIIALSWNPSSTQWMTAPIQSAVQRGQTRHQRTHHLSQREVDQNPWRRNHQRSQSQSQREVRSVGLRCQS